MNRKSPWGILALALLVVAWSRPALAGEFSIKWNPVAGASGYRVYYGVQPGIYTGSITSSTSNATISGLQDCQSYYVAVKAFNAAGESPRFSNELTGWARPVVTSATPSSAAQGEQIVMDILGSNFQDGAVVDLNNPHVRMSAVSVVSCTHIQLLATVEPTASNARAARVGRLDVAIENPDSVFGVKSHGFEVLVNPARFDVNRSDSSTTDRIDGKDTVYLSRQFGLAETDPNYEADYDFDGDGWVDGQDLAYVASNLGRCWSTVSKSWSFSACPADLQ